MRVLACGPTLLTVCVVHFSKDFQFSPGLSWLLRSLPLLLFNRIFGLEDRFVRFLFR